MEIIQKIAGLFYLVLFTFLGMGFGVLALITLLPAAASRPNFLVYYGVCSFAPVSTMILLVLCVVFLLLSFKTFKSL